MKRQPGSRAIYKKRGFARAASLLQEQIRSVGESRGFAVSRLLTHWAEIVGEETARTALPVKISYAQGGFGATLSVLTTGSHAPMLQAELPKILDKVNACYGYRAISRIRITQTAPVGFAEGRVAFQPAPPPASPAPDPAKVAAARQVAHGVQHADLRTALEELGENILSRTKQ